MVTITFLKFPISSRWYAFRQMGKAHQWLECIAGCTFYKLMGSGGRNGFSIWPDFSTYCLLMNWQSKEARLAFFQQNRMWKDYLDKVEDSFTLVLLPLKAKGSWDGLQPFNLPSKPRAEGSLVVLTRATIKRRYIPYFWSQVPKASANVKEYSGHLFSKGVGEVPLLHQATISMWQSRKAMHNYAYQSKAHVEMIQKTRSKGWYKEELFAEFLVQEVIGQIW